ncbi:L-2-amino-thiazoline-4-carboxylic acid hydrolase [Desulfovibrio sp. X2]|uniref:L-2-amino-thiazoline-4-carboxylic acid hydrolase n=1 Tax=Desulfovibrio sp. X2 TaxID=941449 RepID=UPI000358A665|nr:L-2-amino-thiazoline-4-carboxylic acid hydrolase [Desulfovibrio sp. X2]EPR42279.1 L-2-amino-thiazoline-4-carboxylic acid hydrolase [Desulfovibrio sp. X2]
MEKTALTNLERRTIEANIISTVFEELCGRMERTEALSVICDATRRAAWDFGAAFAREAQNGPSLPHFATVLDFWQAGDALRISNVRLDPSALTFTVTHCAYVERYREMGLADDLIYCISCARDSAFAQAYSPRLSLQRPQVISQGAPSCLFTFSWRA